MPITLHTRLGLLRAGALLLVAASPGDYTPPTHVFGFNGTTLTEVPDPPNSANFASNDPFMLILPTALGPPGTAR